MEMNKMNNMTDSLNQINDSLKRIAIALEDIKKGVKVAR